MELLGFSTAFVVILTVLLVTLLLTCVGLGVMSPQSGRRKAFFSVAGFLALLLGGGSWFLAMKEAPSAMMPAAEQKAPEKKNRSPRAASSWSSTKPPYRGRTHLSSWTSNAPKGISTARKSGGSFASWGASCATSSRA